MVDSSKPAGPGPHMTPETMKMKVNYDGVILTTIDVQDAPTEGRPNRVTFSDTTKGRKDDDDAVFLHNIHEVARTGEGYGTKVDYEADRLTTKDAMALLAQDSRKVLFVIHGFNTQASFHLLDCTFANEKAKNVQIVPICWPSEGKMLDYFEDKGYSKAAGFALQKSMKGPMKDLLAGDIKASILCHSMGNRVFRHFADPTFKFDNIFLCAADVDGDIFHEDASAEKKEQAKNIVGMLSDENEGKVHVIYNKKDDKLGQSKFMNLFEGERLGASGVRMEAQKRFFGLRSLSSVSDDCKDNIVNVDATEKGFLYDYAKDHNYHFYDKTVEYYDEHA